MEKIDQIPMFVSNCIKTSVPTGENAPIVAYDPEKRVVLCSSLEIKKGHSLSQEEKLQKTGEQEDINLHFLCRLHECTFFRRCSCRQTKASEFSVLN